MPPKEGKGNTTSGGMTLRSDRRLSADGLEAITTTADLADLDGQSRAATIGTLSSSPLSSPISNDDLKQIAAMLPLLQRLTAAGSSGAAVAPPLRHTGVANGVTASAPSTTAPAPSTHGAAAASGGSNDSLQRLISGVSFGGRSTLNTPIDDEDDDKDDAHDQSFGRIGARVGTIGALTRPVTVPDLEYKGLHIPGEERWLIASMPQVRSSFGGSFQVRFQHLKPKELRDRHEISHLAAIVDACIDGRADVAAELAVRRILGIEQAAIHGDWDAATALDVISPAALGNEELRRHLRRETVKVKALKPKAAAIGAPPNNGHNGGGHKNRRNKNKNKKGGGGAGRGEGAAATDD